MKNKIVIMSINGAKGLERKVVILLGFDSFFDNFHKREYMPNILYVALTRSSEHLIITHCSNNYYSKFIKRTKI